MRLRLDPALRLSLGLISIVLALLVALDALLGLTPPQIQAARELRKSLAEALAVQAATLIQVGAAETLVRTLDEVAARNPQIESIGVRQAGGRLLAHTERHVELWRPPVGNGSTLTQVRVPLLLASGAWGEVEVVFAPQDEGGVLSALDHPTFLTALLVGVIGFALFYLYLRHSLVQMHPARAIPERVRQAFDTLPDGVAVLDHGGRVVLVNRAFRRLHPAAAHDFTGAQLSTQAWLAAGLSPGWTTHPWSRCLADGAATAAQLLQIPQPEGHPLRAVVRCAPIHDDQGELRGCLVSFDDVSDLQQANEQLRATLSQLELSRRHVEQQNRQLHLLATRDSLTDCLNRRAFFEEAEPLFARASQQGKPLACIMADIDRFKALNDRYGHGFGDAAIRSVASLLSSGLRQGDLLCRYGGEEFCMLLPDVNLEQAASVAERLRELVERRAGGEMRAVTPPTITCSFGVAVLEPRDGEVSALVDRADRVLYAAKDTGRNRVVSAASPPATAQAA